MHHGWTGGRAACEGRVAVSGTVGLGTDVEIFTVGIPDVAGAVDVDVWGAAKAV